MHEVWLGGAGAAGIRDAQAVRTAPLSRLTAIDQGRRALHNELSERLQALLADKVAIDFETARRLFTLICVLQIRA